MSKIAHVTARDFTSEVLRSDLPVLVDFYATWCGPCRIAARILEGLAEEFAGRVRFVKVNVDEEPALAAQFEVSSIPTMLFVENGNPVDVIVGLPPASDLRERLESLASDRNIRRSA